MGKVNCSLRPLILLFPVCVTVACARPAEVRRVAASAQPIVASIKHSASNLEGDMADQRQFREQSISAHRDLQREADASYAVTTREWRLVGKAAFLKRMEVLKEDDGKILADPLFYFKAPSSSPLKSDKIDVSSLAQVSTALGTLRSATRMSFGDLAAFAYEVNEERAQIDAAQAAAPQQ